jgi:hypothetical protein
MQREGKTDDILGVTITYGYEGPPDLFSAEERQELREVLAKPASEALEYLLKKVTCYVPTDPAHPWRDTHVRSCAQRFLRDVVLPKWINHHPHKPCSNIRVDEWGRPLCRWINSNNGVDGPWENPTHFLFYCYNTFAAYVEYGTTMNGYLKAFWNIELA